MSCPNCGKPALGERCVRLQLRGTKTPVDAAICSDCGRVYVPEQERDAMNERLLRYAENREQREKNQMRLDEVSDHGQQSTNS